MQEIKKWWKKVKLGEIALEIRNNFNPKKEREQIYLWLEHIEQQTLRISSYWSSNETLSLKLKAILLLFHFLFFHQFLLLLL